MPGGPAYQIQNNKRGKHRCFPLYTLTKKFKIEFKLIVDSLNKKKV